MKNSKKTAVVPHSDTSIYSIPWFATPASRTILIKWQSLRGLSRILTKQWRSLSGNILSVKVMWESQLKLWYVNYNQMVKEKDRGCILTTWKRQVSKDPYHKDPLQRTSFCWTFHVYTSCTCAYLHTKSIVFEAISRSSDFLQLQMWKSSETRRRDVSVQMSWLFEGWRCQSGTSLLLWGDQGLSHFEAWKLRMLKHVKSQTGKRKDMDMFLSVPVECMLAIDRLILMPTNYMASGGCVL